MIKYSEEIKSMNLFEKICNISAEVVSLGKDTQVGNGYGSYKAVSLEKVISVCSEKMSKYGIMIYTSNQKCNFTNEEATKKDGSRYVNRVLEFEAEYTIVNIHNPAEKIVTYGNALGVDTNDKGSGKAQSYAYKNMLLKIFNISTGHEDLDKVHSDDYNAQFYSAPVAPPSTPINRVTNNQYIDNKLSEPRKEVSHAQATNNSPNADSKSLESTEEIKSKYGVYYPAGKQHERVDSRKLGVLYSKAKDAGYNTAEKKGKLKLDIAKLYGIPSDEYITNGQWLYLCVTMEKKIQKLREQEEEIL